MNQPIVGCQACGSPVSVEAKACPRCGQPTMLGRQAQGRTIALVLVVIGAAVSVGLLLRAL